MYVFALHIRYVCMYVLLLHKVASLLLDTVHTSYNLNVTRVYHACVDHKMHTQFCCKRVTSCVVCSEPRTREKTHELRVHVYTFLFTPASVLVIHTHNLTCAQSYSIA